MEKEFERLDDLQRNGLKIIQDRRLFCFGTDAVLLADFASVPTNGKVLDLCSGNGIVPLLLSQKSKASSIVGVELLPESYALAVRNAELNGLSERIRFVCGDLKNWAEFFTPHSFDHITCNPPYVKYESGITNEQDALAIARHEIHCTLEDVVAASAPLLQSGGKLTMVHRPQRLADLFYLLRTYRLEPKRFRLVYPSPSKAANMVLVEAALDGKVQVIAEPPLFLRQENGAYTEEVYQIYGGNIS